MLILYEDGAIAQLGERLHGMQEVVGSNPIGSIDAGASVYSEFFVEKVLND